MEEAQYSQIVAVALKAGAIMLESGGEIYRVEETMTHISMAYGVKTCDCYATPTKIIFTAYDENDRAFTAMKRISERMIDLNKVAAVNRISRCVVSENWDIEKTRARLEEIHEMVSVKPLILLLASGIASGAFTVVFGGRLTDIPAGIFCGLLLRLVTWGLIKINLGAFFVHMAGGAFASFISWVFFSTGLASDWTILVIASLMLIVPGLVMTNGFRDIVAGNLISGVSRTIEALTITASLACGAAAVYYLLSFLGGSPL